MINTINVKAENNEIVIRATAEYEGEKISSITKLSPYVAEFVVRQYFKDKRIISADAGNDETVVFGRTYSQDGSRDDCEYVFFQDKRDNVFCFIKNYFDQVINDMMFCIHSIDENVF